MNTTYVVSHHSLRTERFYATILASSFQAILYESDNEARIITIGGATEKEQSAIMMED